MEQKDKAFLIRGSGKRSDLELFTFLSLSLQSLIERHKKQKNENGKGKKKQIKKKISNKKLGKKERLKMIIAEKKIEEIAKDIREAYRKACDGEKLSDYERFLVDQFINNPSLTVEAVAKKIKKKFT